MHSPMVQLRRKRSIFMHGFVLTNNTQSLFTVIISLIHHNAIDNREVHIYLTNKEAVLCLVVKRTGSDRSRQQCRQNTRCSSVPTSRVLYRLLSVLQQNRAQSRLLYLFKDIESINFLTHWAIIFSNQKKRKHAIAL